MGTIAVSYDDLRTAATISDADAARLFAWAESNPAELTGTPGMVIGPFGSVTAAQKAPLDTKDKQLTAIAAYMIATVQNVVLMWEKQQAAKQAAEAVQPITVTPVSQG